MSFWKGLKEGFKEFNYNLSAIFNSLLLFIVYIVGVGVTSIFAKLVGKHFLKMKFRKESYWDDLNLRKESIEKYFRQF